MWSKDRSKCRDIDLWRMVLNSAHSAVSLPLRSDRQRSTQRLGMSLRASEMVERRDPKAGLSDYLVGRGPDRQQPAAPTDDCRHQQHTNMRLLAGHLAVVLLPKAHQLTARSPCPLDAIRCQYWRRIRMLRTPPCVARLRRSLLIRCSSAFVESTADAGCRGKQGAFLVRGASPWPSPRPCRRG